LRQEEAAPIWASLGEWLEGDAAARVLPKSKRNFSIMRRLGMWGARGNAERGWAMAQSVAGLGMDAFASEAYVSWAA